MVEVIVDCYDGKVHGREAKVQLRVRRIKYGVRVDVWDLDCNELVARFRINNFDFEEFIDLAKSWFLGEVNEK